MIKVSVSGVTRPLHYPSILALTSFAIDTLASLHNVKHDAMLHQQKQYFTLIWVTQTEHKCHSTLRFKILSQTDNLRRTSKYGKSRPKIQKISRIYCTLVKYMMRFISQCLQCILRLKSQCFNKNILLA